VKGANLIFGIDHPLPSVSGTIDDFLMSFIMWARALVDLVNEEQQSYVDMEHTVWLRQNPLVGRGVLAEAVFNSSPQTGVFDFDLSGTYFPTNFARLRLKGLSASWDNTFTRTWIENPDAKEMAKYRVQTLDMIVFPPSSFPVSPVFLKSAMTTDVTQ